jgi:DNA-3-methyladenine glycosylase II
METTSWREAIQTGTDHLAKHDPVMAALVEQWGLCDIEPHDNYYQALVSSIIGQQLSVKAASTIRQRFIDLFGGTFPSPEAILDRDPETFRSAGLSGAKARYVHDLAAHVADGRLKIDKLSELSNDEIIRELTDIKGIGEWTAHMFMMFSLGRLDILAVGDLGIRNGIQRLYKLKSLPDVVTVQKIAKQNHWAPYETLACWYIWGSLDNEPI